MTQHVLILDDDTRRYRPLRKYAAPLCHGTTTVHVVGTASEAIAALSRQSYWHLIMLDHAPGGRVFVNSNDPNTGFQVAKFIREHGVKFHQCILHSMNPGGVASMASQLKGLGRVNLIPVIVMR